MGIDPLTHEPLNKEATPQHNHDDHHDLEVNHEESQKLCSHVSSSDNSNAPTENSSTDESRSTSDPGDDDLLMNYIWSETIFLDDSFWNISPETSGSYGNFGLPSSEDNSDRWLLDYKKDFGDDDFGLGCFSDMDMNSGTQ